MFTNFRDLPVALVVTVPVLQSSLFLLEVLLTESGLHISEERSILKHKSVLSDRSFIYACPYTTEKNASINRRVYLEYYLLVARVPSLSKHFSLLAIVSKAKLCNRLSHAMYFSIRSELNCTSRVHTIGRRPARRQSKPRPGLVRHPKNITPLLQDWSPERLLDALKRLATGFRHVRCRYHDGPH